MADLTPMKDTPGWLECSVCGGKWHVDGNRCPACEKNRGKGHSIYKRLLADRLDLHIEKSGGYGTDDDPFANFTAVGRARNQPRFIYPIDRLQEKLTRVYSLISQGRIAELPEEFADIASLADCAHAMLIEDEADGFA